VHSRQSRSRSGNSDTKATHNQNEHNEYSVSIGSDSSEQGGEIYHEFENVTNDNNIDKRTPGRKRCKKKEATGNTHSTEYKF
jgi:hypothetical protein